MKVSVQMDPRQVPAAHRRQIRDAIAGCGEARRYAAPPGLTHAEVRDFTEYKGCSGSCGPQGVRSLTAGSRARRSASPSRSVSLGGPAPSLGSPSLSLGGTPRWKDSGIGGSVRTFTFGDGPKTKRWFEELFNKPAGADVEVAVRSNDWGGRSALVTFRIGSQSVTYIVADSRPPGRTGSLKLERGVFQIAVQYDTIFWDGSSIIRRVSTQAYDEESSTFTERFYYHLTVASWGYSVSSNVPGVESVTALNSASIDTQESCTTLAIESANADRQVEACENARLTAWWVGSIAAATIAVSATVVTKSPVVVGVGAAASALIWLAGSSYGELFERAVADVLPTLQGDPDRYNCDAIWLSAKNDVYFDCLRWSEEIEEMELLFEEDLVEKCLTCGSMGKAEYTTEEWYRDDLGYTLELSTQELACCAQSFLTPGSPGPDGSTCAGESWIPCPVGA